MVRSQLRKRKNGPMIVYRSLRERMLALEMDLMLWFGHAFLAAATAPVSHTYVKHLGTYNGEAPFKDSNTLSLASDEAVNYYLSKRWDVRYCVYDGERAMGTSRFKSNLNRKGIQCIPLAKGAKAQRVERKIGTLKARGRTTKASCPYSLPHSFVPPLVEHTRIMINNDCAQGNEDAAPPEYTLNGNEIIDYNAI